MSNEPTTEGRAEVALTPKECLAALAASRAETAAAVKIVRELRDGVLGKFSGNPAHWSHLEPAMVKADKLLSDLTAAAQAYKDEVARAAVERLLDERRLERALCDCAGPFPNGWSHEPDCTSGHTRRIRELLLAQSPAASDE